MQHAVRRDQPGQCFSGWGGRSLQGVELLVGPIIREGFANGLKVDVVVV
jgi:hypothetical protein